MTPDRRDPAKIDIRDLKSRVLQLLPPSNAIRELILGEEDSLPLQEYLVKAECWARLIRAQGAEFGWAQAVQRGQEKVAVELRTSRIEALNQTADRASVARPRRPRGVAMP